MADELANVPTPLEEKLERLAQLKAEIAKTAPLKAEFDELKTEVQYEMEASGSARTTPVAGIMAVMSETQVLEIEDEEKLTNWLEENVMDPMAFYKLDVTGLKTLAEERLRDDGELLPGIKTITRRTLSIRSAKK